MLVNLDCPVELIDYKLFESKANSQIYCSMTFYNLSPKTVKGLKVIIHCYDQFGDPVGGETNKFECKVEYKEGLRPSRKRATDKKILLSGFQNTRKIEVDVVKILYDDDTLWSKGASESIKIELAKIENNNLLEFVQSREGKDVKNYAKEVNGHWLCICGRLNFYAQSKCKRCDRLKQYVLTEYRDEEAIISRLNAFNEERIEEDRRSQEKRELEAALRKQKLVKKVKRSLPFIAGGLLVIGILGWGYATNFTFSMKAQQELTDVANLIPKPEVVKEGIIDTSFAAYDDNNGQGDFAITYGKVGNVNNIVVSNITKPQAIDIDHNGTYEFIITYIMDFPENSHALTLGWDDVYEFDVNKEELVLASAKYPDYYKYTYIPALDQRISASNDPVEQQLLSVPMKAAEDLLNGNFVPDASHAEITKLIEAKVLNNPLQIVRKDNLFYIYGITRGMNISEAISVLGEPDESFEVDSKVCIWYLDNNLELVAEYSIDTIHYIALGEFKKDVLDQSMSVLGDPTEAGSNEYSYFSGDQRLRFHVMPGSGDFRVQLFDSEAP